MESQVVRSFAFEIAQMTRKRGLFPTLVLQMSSYVPFKFVAFVTFYTGEYTVMFHEIWLWNCNLKELYRYGGEMKF